jgi:hypothetical protein
MGDAEFSVYQFLKGGFHERVRAYVTAEEAVKAFVHYTNNVASKMGITYRVIITDGGDCTVCEWTKEKGLNRDLTPLCETHNDDK